MIYRFFFLMANTSVDSDGKIVSTTIPDGDASSLVTNIFNTVLFLAGLIAVGMLVYSGIQYVTSHGDPGKTKTAMNSIIYSIAGLVIVILAYAIVNFVIGSL